MGRTAKHIDWILNLALGFICTFGLFLLFSVDKSLFVSQALYSIAGVAVLILMSRFDRLVLWWSAPYLYILSLFLLVLPYFAPAIRGAQRWIQIGSLQLQPSELIKPFLLIVFARLIETYPPRKIKYVPLHFILFVIPFLLVFRQPDLGTSIVLVGMWLAMMVAGGLPIVAIVSFILISFTSVPFVWPHLAAYQQARITTFLNPGIDPKGTGYNALQAVIAIGSGQIFGRGLGRGTQSHLRFLPEYHTDFIFATLVEELGFIGGILLIGVYAILLWRILAPLLSGHIQRIFPFVFSIGLFSMMLVQIVIHAGMNMGIIPVTGITLPFVSYGGSSILSLTIAFGMLWALRRSEES